MNSAVDLADHLFVIGTIKIESIQILDTLMSDGYFHIFQTDKSNQNVSEVSNDPSSELIVSVPNTDE